MNSFRYIHFLRYKKSLIGIITIIILVITFLLAFFLYTYDSRTYYGVYNGGYLLVDVPVVNSDAIKAGIEFLGNKLGESIVVLANDKMVAVKVSDSFVQKGVNAGQIVGEISRATGANGGGRPNFAQGGIKDASKLNEILAKIEAELK